MEVSMEGINGAPTEGDILQGICFHQNNDGFFRGSTLSNPWKVLVLQSSLEAFMEAQLPPIK